MSRRDKRDEELVRALEALAPLGPGREFKHEVSTDELVVEVSVRVRRRAPPDAIRDHRTAALELLSERKHDHCQALLSRRGRWSKYRAGCDAAIVAAVVYTSWRGDRGGGDSWITNSYHFVCGRHRDKHGIDPKLVLAVVELPAAPVAEIRAAVEADRARRYREQEINDALARTPRACPPYTYGVRLAGGRS